MVIITDCWDSNYEMSGLYYLDIPTDMPALTHGRSTDPSNWPEIEITPTKLRRSAIPYDHAVVLPIGYRPSLTSSSWFLDLFVRGKPRIKPDRPQRDPDSDVEDEYADDPNPPYSREPVVSRMSFDLADWTSEVEFLPFDVIKEARDANFWFRGNYFFGTIHCALSESGEWQAIVPKFDDGNGHAPSWVKLILPDGVKAMLPESLSPRMKWEPSLKNTLFDMRTGRLFICLSDGLHILHY